jgi:outer membrane protein insertion porin family
MDLNYRIAEHAQSYVEKIIIQGNNRTKDKVIRRELALGPGQVYDSVRAKASKERLKNLGYFEKVEINPQDTPVENRKNMVVTVEEKRTGSISFGAGFSSTDSILGFVELSQGNFDIGNFPYLTGGGQKFRTRLQYGAKRKDFTVNFTEPWFLDKRLSFGVDLFAHDNQYDSSYYKETNIGAAVRLARGFGQHWIGQIKYQLEYFDIKVENGASAILRQEDGSRTKSSVTTVLTYDTRDSVFLTHRGEKVDFTAEVAGGPLLGQTDIYRLQVDAQKYYPLPWDLIFLTAGSVGVVNSYDNTSRVPIFDRLFAGGSRSVRGFKNRELGPLDEYKDPIGGRTYGYANFELTFPIIDRVRGAFFSDWGFVNESFLDFRNEYIRYVPGTGVRQSVKYDGIEGSFGMGLRLNLPVGPLRLDLGVPIKSNSVIGKSPQFHFDVGYQF